jgi:FkbM family methyltransferase
VRVVIPSIATLGSVANGVLESIPAGLTKGDVSAGLYGLGFAGHAALPKLMQRGVRLVSCHDTNEALVGTFAHGLPVCAVGDLSSNSPEFVIVTARHAVQAASQMLTRLGIKHVSYDAWQAALEFNSFCQVHDHILFDDTSKTVLRAVLMTMLTGEKSHCESVYEKDQYFCLPRFCGSEKEVYVDAGAFVGDSIERFIWSHSGVFSRIYAFEPGPHQFAALQARVQRLTAEWALDSGSVELVNAALGESGRSILAASGNGQLTNLTVGCSSSVGGIAVDLVDLDTYLKGSRITFLKADVEGMEIALLRGARGTIQRHMPKIAICVYHHPGDIPEIANYLYELVPDYRFALRHHSPQLLETVLYCWID